MDRGAPCLAACSSSQALEVSLQALLVRHADSRHVNSDTLHKEISRFDCLCCPKAAEGL